MKTPDLFIAGLPGCGKSHFGRWLEAEHGYLHIDLEKEENGRLRPYRKELFQMIDIRNPEPLIDALSKESKPVVFSWGFPIGYMDVAASLAHRLSPYWFRADLLDAKASFVSRGDVPVAAFERQVSDISRHSFALDAIFGARVVDTILSGGQKVPCSDIFSIILKYENEN